MAIWDFTDYETDDLYEIANHVEELEGLGIDQDDYMKRELYAEIKEREDYRTEQEKKDDYMADQFDVRGDR